MSILFATTMTGCEHYKNMHDGAVKWRNNQRQTCADKSINRKAILAATVHTISRPSHTENRATTHHVCRILPQLFVPISQMLIRHLAGHIKHQDTRMCTVIIGRVHACKTL
jgi:hypothetical protein